ncbi:MAG: ribosome small subunit-dependent GTPase A [Bacteroidetes bacterium]|nr:MAG: ribosome small subunit-dependent GTPase A [Bacteroidota bacterium]TAG90047.1 MAG: ribosome small subunit-dependent GTPase A [Bacteroidota bacterium]
MQNKGLIMRSTGSWYEVQTESKKIIKCRLRGKLKLKGLKVTNPIAVGDYINFTWEEGEPDLGNITDILPRENYIIRQSVHKTQHAHIIAANIDQAVLLATLAHPRTSLGFIDRFLVTAESFRIDTKIIFNKVDLLSVEDKQYLDSLVVIYERLGYKCYFTAATTGEGIKEVKDLLAGKKTLLSGHSGVGKSTLVNQIAPNLDLKTSEISDFADKGVHTTTFATMFEFEENSYLIDTPGIKELGLIDLKKEEIAHYFPEMRELLGQCKYHNCLHLNEPKCAILEKVSKYEISPTRYASYLSMLQGDDNRR